MPTPDDLLENFRAGSANHWAAIAGTALLCVALAAWRRRWRDTPAAARTLDRALAALALLAWIVIQAAQWTGGGFPVRTALPFHISDVVLLAVPVALWTGWRGARALLYYWGIALTSTAFLMPDLRDGPARLGYWLFWVGHAIIMAGVVYDLVGRDFRPAWRDFARVAVLSLLYAALIVPYNAFTGHSYGYLGPPHPEEPPALRHFGPWPLRIALLLLTALAVMALLTVPWECGRRNRTGR
jgi:hypothetical integral membrane protein (TIGR02206 family)